MTRTYRPVSSYGTAVFGEDDFTADWSAVEERDMVDNGHVEIVPRPYTVTSDNTTYGELGDVVELALPVETEAALIFGGHLEPVQETVKEEPEPEPEPAEDESEPSESAPSESAPTEEEE